MSQRSKYETQWRSTLGHMLQYSHFLPSVLSEVLIGHADALHVRPLLPNLHAAYAPGTPVDPSVWDSQ